MANVRHLNILEISKFCKTVEAAYNYAKNCGFVVDVLSADAQSTQNTAHCILLDVLHGTLYHTVVRQLSKTPCSRCEVSQCNEWTCSFWATVCKTFPHILSDRCLSVCPSCLSVCGVSVLWPSGWMD